MVLKLPGGTDAARDDDTDGSIALSSWWPYPFRALPRVRLLLLLLCDRAGDIHLFPVASTYCELLVVFSTYSIGVARRNAV